MRLVAEPYFIFSGTLNGGSEPSFSADFGESTQQELNNRIHRIKYEISLPVIQAKAKKLDATGPRERNPGTYPSQYYYKPQMRHSGVARATTMCRIGFLTDFNIIDYEGKRGKKTVSRKEKVRKTHLESEKYKHFCGKWFFAGGFPEVQPPLRR